MSETYSYYKGEPYQKYSCFQAGIVSKANKFILEAARKIRFDGEVLTICDYGCSDGYNSFKLMESLIGLIRKTHGPNCPVQLIYEDLPYNDFNRLFQAVNNKVLFVSVFLSAVPISFYKQTVPNGSVNLALSTTAFHWLPSSPCPVSHGLVGQMSDIKEERVAWQTAAAEAWEKLLLCRASEMAEGGVACFSILGNLDDGNYDYMFERMNDIYKGMLADCLVTKDEYERSTVNCYFRSEEELLRPFMTNTPVYNAGLRLTSSTWEFISEAHLHKQNGQDSELAEKLVLEQRVYTNHAFRSALSDSRTDEEKDMIVDQFYSRYRQLIKEDPRKYFHESPVMFLELRKI